ncbi:MAG: hypothetical protein KBF89_01350 [Acidimicrobiia bacterium]|nr:hypothetical protein [Acidimicrobiia bacterium]
MRNQTDVVVSNVNSSNANTPNTTYFFSQLGTTPKALRDLARALNPDLASLNPDAYVSGKKKEKGVTFPTGSDTERTVAITDTSTFLDQLATPRPDFANTTRHNSAATLHISPSEQLEELKKLKLLVDQVTENQELLIAEGFSKEVVQTMSAEELAQRAAELQQVEILRATEALRLQQIADLQAAEIAKRAKDTDTPSFIETLGGSFAVELLEKAAKIGLGVTVASAVAPIIAPIALGSFGLGD